MYFLHNSYGLGASCFYETKEQQKNRSNLHTTLLESRVNHFNIVRGKYETYIFHTITPQTKAKVEKFLSQTQLSWEKFRHDKQTNCTD